MLTDQDILLKFKEPASQEWAFEQIVRKYQQKLYWHIRRMVVNHDDANDVTQDTFIKVWGGLKNYHGDAKLYTWLYRIASNEAITFINKKKRMAQISMDDVSPELLEHFIDSPLVEADYIQQKLYKAILTLPDKQRLVFNLKYFDDLTYEEISEITTTSVGALKASYHLAVKKIEENLAID